MRDAEAAIEMLSCAAFMADPFEWLGDEVTNLLSARWHGLKKETPGKTWWHAEAMHPAIFRALQMDRAEEGAIYGAAPFRLYRDPEAGPRILTAFPCPPLFSDEGDDWLGVETVLSWDPRADTAEVLGDVGNVVIGAVPPGTDTLDIFASPFAFLRRLAEERARWFVSWCAVNGDWTRKPSEPDLTPGLLLLGDAEKARWPLHAMPAELRTHGIDARTLNRALIRQARLPRAVDAPQEFRRAA